MRGFEYRETDWITEFLVCPDCLSKLFFEASSMFKCTSCGLEGYTRNGIPLFPQPFKQREYKFEQSRYGKIALNNPETYPGYYDSYPDERNRILKQRLRGFEKYLNIGAGWGSLEKTNPSKMKYVVDQCYPFLEYIKDKAEIPKTRCIRAWGERLPFPNESLPAVVSDSVFQTVVNQREFLIENARVLKKGGVLLLAITYKWNYPRKPQDFPVDNTKLLTLFLHELGVEMENIYFYNLESKSADIITPETNHPRKVISGDYMLFRGVKN